MRPPVWHLYVLYGLAGCLGVATIPVTHSRVVANWFDRKRGLALGVASMGVGFGAFLGPSLAQFLIDKLGWRLAYLGLAALPLLIALPVVAMFLIGRPQDVGLLPDGAKPHPKRAAASASKLRSSRYCRAGAASADFSSSA